MHYLHHSLQVEINFLIPLDISNKSQRYGRRIGGGHVPVRTVTRLLSGKIFYLFECFYKFYYWDYMKVEPNKFFDKF